VIDAARRSGLLQPGAPVVVMLSGGPDSTCLLDVAVTIVGSELVTALHVNHGFRPDAVDADVCSETCAALGVELEVRNLNPEQSMGNLQSWARDSRYSLANEEAEKRNALVAVGHTASDQAETILYRLAAAPGRRALFGMQPRVGNVVRPLLTVDQLATRAYCSSRGLATVDDPSNATDRFARGRVRHGLIPALREIHPAAEANVVATSEILRDEAVVLDELVLALISGEPPTQTIPLELLRAQSPALRRLVVQRMAEGSVGHLAPGVARRADDVASLGPNWPAMLDLPSGVRAIVERGILRFVAHRPADG
jgi:tRNA(Ile)-lysidine synthase